MKKLFAPFLLLAMLASTAALATNGGTRATLLGDQYFLNQTDPPTSKLGDKVITESEHVLRGTYSFAVQGGTSQTALSLVGDDGKTAYLPKGAIIRDCIIDVITVPADGGIKTHTVSIGTSQSATGKDLKDALAGASATGLVACIPVGTAATAIKLTDDRYLTVSFGGSKVSTGKFYVVIHYELSNTL